MGIILGVIMLFSMAFAAEEVAEYGNTICPLSGEKIVDEEAIRYEYEGVAYNLCCKMCVKDFEKDPEKYIEKLEKEGEVEAHEHHHH